MPANFTSKCWSNFYPSTKLKIFNFWPIGAGVNKGYLGVLDKVTVISQQKSESVE